MSKNRLDYNYVAAHLDTPKAQHSGDHTITHRPGTVSKRRATRHYEYDSHTGNLTNRATGRRITPSSRTYRKCLAAIARLFVDDDEAWLYTETLKRLTDGDSHP